MYRPFLLNEFGEKVPCAVEGCEKYRQRKNGFCDPHYWRNHKNGSPTAKSAKRRVGSNSERFWDKVEKTEECWIWVGSLVDGYGTFRFNFGTDDSYFYGRGSEHESSNLKKVVKAHRLSFFWANGRWPKDEMHIDHLCRVRACVNPLHLEEVTQSENNKRNPNWSGNGGKTIEGIKRPITWMHNRFHVRGLGKESMENCAMCVVAC